MCPQFVCRYHLQQPSSPSTSPSSTLKILNNIRSQPSLRWKQHKRQQQSFILCQKSSSLFLQSNCHNITTTRIIIYLLSNIFLLLSFLYVFVVVVANDELQISSSSSNDSTNIVATTELPSSSSSSVTQNYTIRNLEPYTEYFVTLRVFNPKGDGPVATLAATTDEGGNVSFFGEFLE